MKLTGLIFDDDGRPMRPTYTRKADGREYRYYASDVDPIISMRTSTITRVPAAPIEAIVEQALQRFGLDGSDEQQRTPSEEKQLGGRGRHSALYFAGLIGALFAPTACPDPPDVWRHIGRLVDTIDPTECANYFANAGYAPVKA